MQSGRPCCNATAKCSRLAATPFCEIQWLTKEGVITTFLALHMSCCFIMPHLTLFLGPSALACLPACPPACTSDRPSARPSARPSWADPYTCSSWVEPLDFTSRFFSFLPRFAGPVNPPFLFFLGALPHFCLPPRGGWSCWISQVLPLLGFTLAISGHFLLILALILAILGLILTISGFSLNILAIILTI